MWNYFPDMEPVIHENADLMQVLARLADRWDNRQFLKRYWNGQPLFVELEPDPWPWELLK